MKPPFLLLAFSTATLLTGCTRSIAELEHDHHDHEHAPAATYKEGHGLQLSEAGSRFVALGTTDVDSRNFNTGETSAAIPDAALLRTVKGDFVYVANGEWFLRTPVTLGARDGRWLEVREGLYEGDRVVVEGVRDLWLAEVHAVNGGVGCAHGH